MKRRTIMERLIKAIERIADALERIESKQNRQSEENRAQADQTKQQVMDIMAQFSRFFPGGGNVNGK